MSGVELAACPFCGGLATLEVCDSPECGPCGFLYLGCFNDDCAFEPLIDRSDGYTTKEAIAAWNRRAVPMEWREKVAATCHKLLCDELGLHPDEAADSAGVFADAILQALALIPQGTNI